MERVSRSNNKGLEGKNDWENEQEACVLVPSIHDCRCIVFYVCMMVLVKLLYGHDPLSSGPCTFLTRYCVIDPHSSAHPTPPTPVHSTA